jgi:hypothetical protein
MALWKFTPRTEGIFGQSIVNEQKLVAFRSYYIWLVKKRTVQNQVKNSLQLSA